MSAAWLREYQVRERFALVFAWLEVNIRALIGRA